MPESQTNALPWRMVTVPAAITLMVTLLRLAGELLHWSPALFSSAAGGGGALVGISWLPPIFGIWFGIQLARAGGGPARPLAGAGLLVLALALVPLAGLLAAKVLGANPQGRRMLLASCAAAVVAVPIAMRAWPALGRALLAYALAARVPVAVLMRVAMFGNRGTHYDVVPGFSGMAPFVKWLWFGLLPQMTVWIWFTVVVGGLFGLMAGLLAARGRTTAPAAACGARAAGLQSKSVGRSGSAWWAKATPTWPGVARSRSSCGSASRAKKATASVSWLPRASPPTRSHSTSSL